MSYENTAKPWSGMYMQRSTYKHDFVPANGISPRNRQTNYPYGADAPKADIAPPYTNFRPRFSDPLPPHIRDLDGQRYDDQPLTERQRVKRGEEWIGGRRYDEPLTDRGVYIPPRKQYYERDRGRDISPNRRDDRMYKPEDGRYTSLDRRDDGMYNTRDDGRYTSLDRYQDRGMNGSPERYYDRGRDLDRGRGYDRARDGSPSKFREYDQGRNAYNGYNDRYEQPVQPGIESYADHKKMADRTTYKDYGEFLQEKIKMEELRKQPLEYPAANLGPNYVNDRYLRPEERQLRHQLDYDKSPVTESKPENQDVRPQTEPALPIRSDFEPKSTNSGVYLFVRTNKLAKADVVKALQEGRSVLANSYGQLKGIATSREINLLEGRADGWTNKPSTEANKVWDIDDIVIIIWFPTSKEAEMWLCHEKHFRNASFPEFYGSDIVVLPINWNPTNDRHYPTFLVTEYEGIVDPDQFREKFVTNMNGVLQRHKAERFVIQTVGIKNLRGNWFKKRSVVTCNRFPSSEAAYQFYNDPEYENLRRSLRDISKNRTTVMFTLTERPV